MVGISLLMTKETQHPFHSQFSALSPALTDRPPSTVSPFEIRCINMPFPGEGPWDQLFRSMTLDEDEDNVYNDNMFRGWPRHGGMMSQQQGVHVYQDEHEIQVDVDMPGVGAKDIHVQVCNQQPASGNNCVVQWSAERTLRRRPGDYPNVTPSTTRFMNRIRLGPSVDCDQLAANLSRGVLRLTAPLKEENEAVNGPRSIPITTDLD